MAILPKHRYPDDFGVSERFETFYPIKYVNDDVVAVVYSKPVVERSLSPRSGNFHMLSETNFGSLGRETYVAIDGLRPEPDPVDHSSGSTFGRHRVPALSATSRHNMQLTQFSTSVPCSAICRNRM